MTSLETAALVALLRTPEQPPHVYAELVEQCGSALALLKDRGANSPRPRLFSDEEPLETQLDKAAADLAGWEDQGFKALTVLDPGYPENLRAVHDRPPLVFVAGELTPNDARSVAVIGSRRASPAGIENAQRIARHLVATGYTVVSGLAVGIDTAAHTAALAAHGRTIAVIGTGLAHAYPPQNAALQRRIAAEHAVVSQFWPDAPPTRKTFPKRNATISGLALASVIVEAGERSGARTLARLALAHGRPVFVTPAVAGRAWARPLMARAGVHQITEPEELTAALARLTSQDALVP